MNEPKFKSGDLVWAQTWPYGKEVAAVVVSVAGKCRSDHWIYYVESLLNKGEVCEPYIRPRRDDYQQHEPLGRRADLDKPLDDLKVAILEKLES